MRGHLDKGIIYLSFFFSFFTDIAGVTAALPYVSKHDPIYSTPKPRLRRSQSVDAISTLELDADKYGFPKLYTVTTDDVQQRGRPTNRRRNYSESQQDVRVGMPVVGFKGQPSMKRSGSVDARGGRR